jgi:putative membrane protein
MITPTTRALLLFLGLSGSLAACHGSGTPAPSDSTTAQPAVNPSQDGASKQDSSNIAGPVSVSASDRAFMSEAADGGMTEIQASKAAQSKAVNPRVQHFAGMMVSDHGRLGDQLGKLATSRNAPLPAGVSDAHRKTLDELQTKSGTAFDEAYMKMMVRDHASTVNAFEKADKQVQDTALKNFIEGALPIIRMHLDSARAIARSLFHS